MLLKAFRLFISSTFSDFAQEREILQSKVLPSLDVYCAAKGYQFHAIDLRWGVSQEAQLDQRTTEICLDEVAAAKRYPPPNLLIMVADRYGWVRLPFAIAEDEFEAAVAWLAEHGRAEAVANLRTVYELDENHLVPPGLPAAADGAELVGAYTLRSRENDVPNPPSPEALKKFDDDWTKLENDLRGALQEAVEHLAREGRIRERAREVSPVPDRAGGHPRLARLQFCCGERSAVQGCGTRCCRSAINRLDQRGGGRWPFAAAVVVGAAPGLGLTPAGGCRPGFRTRPRVEKLEAGIRRTLPPDCVLSGWATRKGDGQLDAAYLRTSRRVSKAGSGKRSTSILQNARIVTSCSKSARSTRPFALERRGVFGLERRSIFRGRDSHLAAIASYLGEDSTHPLVLFGPSGLGKSALIAQAVAEAEASGRRVPVVYRFVGASAASALGQLHGARRAGGAPFRGAPQIGERRGVLPGWPPNRVRL